MTVTSAVIPAGGLGTRFGNLTSSIPKEMLPVNGKSLIQIAVEELLAVGITDIVLIISPAKTAIYDFLRDLLPGELTVRKVIQERPLGLGHAVSLARPCIDDAPFALLLPDDMFEGGPRVLQDMFAAFYRTQDPVIAVGKVSLEDTGRYGIVDPEPFEPRLHHIRNLVEKPTPDQAPSNLAIFGRYILTPDIFDCLDNIIPGKNGELQLTDALSRLREQRSLYGWEITGSRYDCGTLDGWLETNVRFGISKEECLTMARSMIAHHLSRP